MNEKRKQLTLLLSIFALLMLSACGGQTKNGASDADSTQVFEVPDTLNTVEAVVKQVNAVYAYCNELREHFDEKKPSVDERFGTKEWLQVREDAWAADRDCECGGFFDFGDEGPLDPWIYDCYEGTVSANDIEAKILPDGMAEVKFLVKDAVTTKGIPMRWLMRVEDDEWRVANIIFEKDGGIDLLESLRNYGWEFKTDKQFDVKKYYDKMAEEAETLISGYNGEIDFFEYALIDVDRDGKAELWARYSENDYAVIFSLDDDGPHALISCDHLSQFSFFKGAIQSGGSGGTGAHVTELVVLKDSKPQYKLKNIEQYDMAGNLSENKWSKDGKDIPTEDGEKLYKSLGDPIDLYVNWHGINFKHE
jgi:hypothetical protein